MSGEGLIKHVYRPDIDGLRAFAVLSVVVYHLFPELLPGGFVGVDVFFVISGFLITGIIISDIDRDRFSILDFYKRRVRRIFPALCVVLAAVLVAGSIFLFTDELRALGLHVLGGATFSSNIILLNESGYFDTAAASKPLLHLWSLGIEEQFYIVWPLLLYFLIRGSRSVIGGLASVAGLSFAANILLVGPHPDRTFYLPFSRFWELALGGLIATTESRRWFGASVREKLRSYQTALSALGIVSLIAAVFFCSEASFPGWWALLPCAGAALTIMAGPTALPSAYTLSLRPAVFVGLISYPLYLWHWPLLVFSQATVATDLSFYFKLVLLAASVVLAWATYRLIEAPIRSGPKRPRLHFHLASALACLGIVGLAIYFNDGLAARGEAFHRRGDVQSWPALTVDRYNAHPLARQLFRDEFQNGRDFFLVPTAPVPSIAVIGDSHANRLAVAIGASDENSDRVLNLGRGTCLPLLNVETIRRGRAFGCQPLMKNIINYVAATDSIKDVALSAFYDTYFDGLIAKAGQNQPADLEAGSRLFRESLLATVRLLVDAGKHVVIVADVPEMRFPISECVKRPNSFSRYRSDCSISLSEHLERTSTSREAIAWVASQVPGVVTLDPTRILCDHDRCYAKLNGELEYSLDGNHLNFTGARRLGRWLLEQGAFSVEVNQQGVE